jgi:hypothetical protein
VPCRVVGSNCTALVLLTCRAVSCRRFRLHCTCITAVPCRWFRLHFTCVTDVPCRRFRLHCTCVTAVPRSRFRLHFICVPDVPCRVAGSVCTSLVLLPCRVAGSECTSLVLLPCRVAGQTAESNAELQSLCKASRQPKETVMLYAQSDTRLVSVMMTGTTEALFICVPFGTSDLQNKGAGGAFSSSYILSGSACLPALTFRSATHRAENPEFRL